MHYPGQRIFIVPQDSGLKQNVNEKYFDDRNDFAAQNRRENSPGTGGKPASDWYVSLTRADIEQKPGVNFMDDANSENDQRRIQRDIENHLLTSLIR